MANSLVELAGARVVVTGGCGLIGSRIGRALADLGAIPVAFDNLAAYPFEYATLYGAADSYHDIVPGDVADPAAVGRALARADYVIHAAAYADVAACSANATESTRTNVLGTQNVLTALRGTPPRRFVNISSASVYGNGPAPGEWQRWSEETPVDPISVYANAKLWSEYQTRLELRATRVEHVTLRYFSVYGEPQLPKRGSHSWCMAWFGLHAIAGLPLRLNNGGIQVRDFIHVDDVALATVSALTAPDAANQVINIGTGVGTQVAEVAHLVAEHFPDTPIVVTPRPPDDPLGGYADITRMTELLDFAPQIKLAEGIARHMDWLRSSAALELCADLLPDGRPHSVLEPIAR